MECCKVNGEHFILLPACGCIIIWFLNYSSWAHTHTILCRVQKNPSICTFIHVSDMQYVSKLIETLRFLLNLNKSKKKSAC